LSNSLALESITNGFYWDTTDVLADYYELSVGEFVFIVDRSDSMKGTRI